MPALNENATGSVKRPEPENLDKNSKKRKDEDLDVRKISDWFCMLFYSG